MWSFLLGCGNGGVVDAGVAKVDRFGLRPTAKLFADGEQVCYCGELAGGGFESTVRLAKSSPAMWGPIFMQNRENVLDVLNEHIMQLRKFKSCLEKENYDYLQELMVNANKIRRILG